MAEGVVLVVVAIGAVFAQEDAQQDHADAENGGLFGRAGRAVVALGAEKGLVFMRLLSVGQS